jgi:formylglycine-generating enzyme required for sulfatase activity
MKRHPKSTLAAFSFLAVFGVGCNGPKLAVNGPSPTPSSVPLGCPTNYVLVPGNTTLGTQDFCIAKFEAKNVAGAVASVAAGTPWNSITRDNAKAACTALGANYSLPDNAHWMTIARNIESVAWNWGGDISLQEYGISRGITNNNSTTGGYAASTDDNNSCYLATVSSGGAAAICDLNTYDVARRVQKLSNGDLIWDFAGNVAEWIADDFTQNFGLNAWVLNVPTGSIKDTFGPSGTYPAGPPNPTGNIYMYNFGYLGSNVAAPAVVSRGGGWDYGRYAGIYTAFFVAPTTAGVSNGFRCMYQP